MAVNGIINKWGVSFIRNSIVARNNSEFFAKILWRIKKTPLIIGQNYAYGAINIALCNKKLLKLEDEPKTNEISHVIKNNISEIEGAGNMCVAYNKNKKQK